MTELDDRSGADSPDLDPGIATASAAAAADRVAQLQRIAFGAGSTESERHSAAAELELLRRAEADAAAEHEVRSALVAEPGDDDLIEAGPDSSTSFEPLAAASPIDARGIRWAIAAGVVALALGLGTGWQLGGRSAPPSESTAGPDASDAAPTAPATVPLGETSMVGSFDRAQVESDLLDPEFVQTYLLDGASTRRLLGLPDGLVVYSAVRDGDLCLIASWTAGADDGAPACTTAQIVNDEGLRTTVVNGTSATTVQWRRDGTVELAPVGERPAEPANADDETEDVE